MEQSIEETRLESVQLESDLSQDPIRNELVPLYSDLMHLTARRHEQERDERNKLSPEQEREKLMRQTKVPFSYYICDMLQHTYVTYLFTY